MIVALISGRGSNLQALAEAGLPVSAVISNRADARGLELAAARGIATRVVEHARFGSREAFESALGAERVSELYAKRLSNDLIQSAETEMRARRKMYNAVMRALPPLKAARYVQLESKIRALYEYDIASTIPLVRAQ